MLLSRVQLFATQWTVAHQAPLSMGFSRQEYWSGLPFPPPGELPYPGTEPMSPALAGGILYHWATREAHGCVCVCAYIYIYACAHTHMLKLIKMYTLKIHLYLHSPKLINPLTVSQGVWGVCVCICLCVRVCACTWEMPGLSLLYVHRAIGSLFLINLFWFFGLFFKGL